MNATPPTIDDIRAAAQRIAAHVRHTPLLVCNAAKRPLAHPHVALKLECLQVTGSCRARDAIRKRTALWAGEESRGLVTDSGCDHGIAIAYARWLLGRP